MHMNGVWEVNAHASRLEARLRLLQRLARHELRFFGDEDKEKSISGESVMVSAWRSIFRSCGAVGCFLSHPAIRQVERFIPIRSFSC